MSTLYRSCCRHNLPYQEKTEQITLGVKQYTRVKETVYWISHSVISMKFMDDGGSWNIFDNTYNRDIWMHFTENTIRKCSIIFRTIKA